MTKTEENTLNSMFGSVKVCIRCGKRLTNVKSIERGYGPVCWKKSQESFSTRRRITSIVDFSRSLRAEL